MYITKEFNTTKSNKIHSLQLYKIIFIYNIASILKQNTQCHAFVGCEAERGLLRFWISYLETKV